MSDVGTASAFFPSRPKIQIDGEQVPGLAEGLLNLRIEEDTEGLFRLEACFANWGTSPDGVGFLYKARDTFDFGQTITIDMGDSGTRAPVFEGKVMALEGRYPQQRPPEFQVWAEDRFQDLRMTRRTRTFEDVSDQDVFEQIAGDHGLRAEIDVDGPDYRSLAQLNQSDLAFLRERARAIDAEVWVEGDGLFVQERSRRRASAEVSLTYGQGLREATVCADLAGQRTKLTVAGWDVAAKEAIAEEATEDAIQSELDGKRSGGSVLGDAFGERAESVVHTVPLTSSEATAVAEARYRSISRRFLTGQAVAEGDARIKVGAYVDMHGLNALFDGEYYVTSARHTFDGQDGFRTSFCFERPFIGGSS